MNRDRGILIAGNWKMNTTRADADAFFKTLRVLTGDESQAGKTWPEACLIPPTLSLARALSLSDRLAFPMHIAAQNAHWEKKGAFTGETSGPMLTELGISWVLIGHSERRQYFGETDETVRKRTESLLAQGFRVIMCIGETREQRETKQTDTVLARQLQAALPTRGEAAAAYLDGRLILAYEPVWAIGTGLTATPAQAEEAHAFIRHWLENHQGAPAAAATKILYGGSITSENVAELLACPNVDGGLVGGASLKAESYAQLLEAGAAALA